MPVNATSSPLDPPAGTDLVLNFVNTHVGGRSDLLGDGDGLRGWLTKVGYPDDGATDADAAVAREVRDALQVLMLAHAGEDGATAEAVAGAERQLARMAEHLPLRLLITADGTRLESPRSGFWAALGTVFAGVAELDRAGVWERVKACRNEICHAGFFDRSRNGSAVYHGPNCASMVSMRAYRRRKKDTGSTDAGRSS